MLQQKEHLIVMYISVEILSASNIFFSNGELDPWRQGGVRF